MIRSATTNTALLSPAHAVSSDFDGVDTLEQATSQREKRQLPANATGSAHRPTFYLNNASTPGLPATLELVNSLVPLDASFGIHQIALLNSPQSIQDVEAALQAAWWASNTGQCKLKYNACNGIHIWVSN